MKTATNPDTGEKMFFNEKAGAWEPIKGISGGDVARAGLSGATLGFGDELRAGAFGLMNELGGTGDFGESYKTYRDSERAKLDQFRQQHPGAAFASEMGGGLLTGIAGGAKVAGTNVARNIAAQGLGTRSAAASLVSGGVGALAGAGEAKEVSDIPLESAKGAGIGMVVGPVAELAATGVQAGARALSPQRSAERAVRRAVERGGMTMGQVQAKLKKMGPDAVLADVNEGLLTELDRLVNVPGATRTRAIKQLTKRSGAQLDEILSASGKGQYFENLDKVKDIKRQLASPLYERAYAKGVTHTQELDDLFKSINDALPGAWNEAKKFGKLDLAGKGQTPPDLGDAVPSLRGWQAMKEYLDDQIGKFMRAGENGKASKILGVKNRLLRELDSQNPDYGNARGIWAGSKEFESAMEEGLGFMKPGLTAAKLRDQMRGLNDTQKLAYREGARQSIQDTMEKAGYTHDASKFFRNPAMAAKLKTMFGPREGTKILRTIENSAAKHRTFSRTTGNSLTALRQAAQGEEGLTQDVIGSVVDLATSNPVSAGGGVLRRAANRIPTSRESTRNLIGDMLLENDPVKQKQLLQWLSQGGKPLPQPTGAGLLAPVALGAGGGLLATR